MNSLVTPTPWDERAFGIPTYEIKSMEPAALDFIKKNPGHYTFKCDPLSNKAQLLDAGFYYVDTLIEPCCAQEQFKHFKHPDTEIAKADSISSLTPFCENTFLHGRFHRDFNLDKQLADQRYINWLNDLAETGEVFGFFYQKQCVGFVACQNEKLVLHALGPQCRGKGLAKFFWTDICLHLFEQGYKEITSSVSAANLAVVNLYASLGFKFRTPVDIYHRLIT